MKRCPDCQLAKSLDEFPRNKNTADGFATYCKVCHRVRGRASLAKNGGTRRYHLRQRYGLEPSEIEEIIEMQNGLCPICLVREPQAMDHDHETGAVRGVICHSCNRAIGVFSDNPDWMERAAAYLRKPPLFFTKPTRYLRGGQ